MTILHRMIVLLGALAIVVMIVYPPWIANFFDPQQEAALQKQAEEKYPKDGVAREAEFERLKTEKTVVKDAGYHFIFENPGRDIDNAYRLFNIQIADLAGENASGAERYFEPNLRNLRKYVTYTVNMPRLIGQCLILTLLTLGMLWVASQRRVKRPTQE